MTESLNPNLLLVIPLAPLAGAVIAGLFGRVVGRSGAHWAAILGVAIALIAALLVYRDVLAGAHFNETVYTWAVIGNLHFDIGFLIDPLTATMMVIVTFVSLMVHIYTVGYMADDPGYQRFFAYIALFTFSMLMLVMANNMLQLFFGWEAVGLVSYLLIGFWYTRPTAIYANLKAFLANRVGDFGFILGIGLLLAATGSLNYADVFARANDLAHLTVPGVGWNLLTAACICLFIGAMGKSAQVPLHVWLPDSMEGPTPISALIHAATMVTAGIFMVARMSPLFEGSDTALSFVLVIGSITALFMGFLGIVQNDIKRVVAYSTLSQLGYMTVALGVSAYPVAIFHLATHAFFKALLFLAAGSVIVGMHHDQDIRNMGGLAKYMRITWFTSLIGSLALIGAPGFAGFYSKDSIIDAVAASHLTGSGFAYFSVVIGVFVTALYSFRMFFLVFHGEERFGRAHHDEHEHDHDEEHHGLSPGEKPHESPAVIWVPLVALAIPSLVIGGMTIDWLFNDYFRDSIFIAPQHEAMAHLQEEFHGALDMAVRAFSGLPVYLAAAGVISAWYLYLVNPALPGAIKARFSFVYWVLDSKYGFDRFNEIVFAGGARALGGGLWKGGDQALIDGLVNGGAHLVGWFASLLRRLQNGILSYYAMVMILGIAGLISWFVVRPMIFH
jgi:NADH-quinone oxidoreductase subunit L